MVRTRAIIAMMCLAPVMLGVTGCVNSRLPAIDPTGQRIFLPNPNYTTLAQDAPGSRLLHHRGRKTGVPLPGPYSPALFNRHRERLSRIFHHNGARRHGRGLLGHFHRKRASNSASQPSVAGSTSPSNAPAFTTPATPPLCGPNGLAPDGSPCYPIGSPSESSLAATIPSLGATSPVGSGLANASQLGPVSTQQSSLARLAQLGPGVVLARPRILAQVGDEVVVVGGVQSTAGIARTGEPVQWSLANNSVGTIVDSARTMTHRPRLFGLFRHASASSALGNGCGNCVRSVTSSRCDVLARNPSDPTDDVYLSRGQTWVSLTSGSEGTSYVTLAAPNLEGRRQATAQIEWIDASWDCPRPVLTSMVGPGRLVTKVCRNSDKRPLAGWTVRHTILDGPTAGLGDGSDERLDVPTDANGQAVMDVYPLSTEPGTTRVGIQIIDPKRPDVPIGRCIGYVTWSSSEPVRQPPALPSIPSTPPTQSTPPPSTDPPPVRPPTFASDGPPTSTPPPEQQTPPFATNPPPPERAILAINVEGPGQANVGDRLPYRVTVRNTSDVVAEDVIVSTSLPELGLRFLSSEPRAMGERGDLAWRFESLQPGESGTVDTIFEATDLGEARNVFFAQALNASEVDDGKRTSIRGGLQMQISQPSPVRVGDPIPYFVQLNNLSSRPMEVSLKVDRWTNGIEPVVGENTGVPNADAGIVYPERLTIPPGPSDNIPIDFRAIGPGTHTFRVLAEGPGGATAQETGTVQILEAPPAIRPPPSPRANLEFEQNYPRQGIPAGGQDRFYVTFKNTGGVALTGVTLRIGRDSDDLIFLDATRDGLSTSQDGRVLTWSIDRIEPGYGSTIQVNVQAMPNPLNDRARIDVQFQTDQGDNRDSFEIDIIEEAPRRQDAFRPELNAANTASLQATINSEPRAVRIGEPIDYVITVRNNNQRSFRDLQVSMEVAEGMKFIGVDGPPAIRTTVSENGLLVDFSSVREILPNERLLFRARVTATRRGIGKLLGRVGATGLSQSLIVSKETTVN